MASDPRSTLAEPSGRIDGRIHRIRLRVYFEDTDLSGVVYHANYLKWFERGRSDFVRLLGIDQRAANEAGVGAFAVTEMHIRFLRAARLDDVVTVETETIELRAASCRMIQRAIRGDTLLAEAQVRAGFVAPAGRARRMPPGWREAFTRVAPAQETA